MGQMGVICISYVLDLLMHWPFLPHSIYGSYMFKMGHLMVRPPALYIYIYIYNRGIRGFALTRSPVHRGSSCIYKTG
jgi:hypothetical protein